MWKLKDFFSPKPQPIARTADESFQRGNAFLPQRQWHAALECYREAVRIDPNHAEAHAYAGNVLRQLGEHTQALAAYEHAIAIKPDLMEAHYNRGSLLHRTGQLQASLAGYERALACDPAFIEAHCGLGDVLRDLGRFDEAMARYDAAIALKGDDANAYLRRASLLRQLQQPVAAEASCKQAVALDPDYADAHFTLGVLQSEAGRDADALASFDRVVRLNPTSARAFGNLAQSQTKLGYSVAARASHDRAISLDPTDAALHFNRGVFLSECKQWAEAAASYEAAIAVNPDYADAFCNLGLAQQEAGRPAEALRSYSRALALDSRLAKVFNNRGNLFRSRKQFAEARDDYRQALALAPDAAEGHYNTAQLNLLQGDFESGWPQYEWRTRIEEALSLPPRHFPFPAWSGDTSLRGKRIFLHAEQGLGDTIQFCRYAALVAALGATVTLEVQPALRNLLAQLDGVSQLTVSGSPVPAADFHCSLMSLPGALKTTLQTIPAGVPYLRADPHKITRWRDHLGPRRRLRVGLVWRGNPRNTNDPSRRVPLARLIAHLPEDVDFICLQNEIPVDDREILAACARIVTVEQHLKDFTDTAALIESLDLVISVCTSVAHLSGALGKKTWVMLAFVADWRWLLERRDSPWYPTVTLYRQSSADDWDGVLAEVRKDLAQWQSDETLH